MTKPSYTHLMSDSITQNPARSMNELDAIAEEAAKAILHSYTIKIEQTEATIRAAIDKALEYALTKEPSLYALSVLSNTFITEVNHKAPAPSSKEWVERVGTVYRAMTKQLLETLKGNSSGARSERSATNKQEG